MARDYTVPSLGRFLTSLKAGGAIVRGDMIILPRGAPDSMRFDADYVCTKGDRYDWKHEEDAA